MYVKKKKRPQKVMTSDVQTEVDFLEEALIK